MFRRGEIHFASLDPVRGHEQAGNRPVLVVSSDAINPRDTVFLCFQVRAIDPSGWITPRAGALPASRMAEVDAALRRALDL